MTTRSELYHAFGPRLLEAVCRVLVDQVNVLRSQAGLGKIDLSQAVNAIKAELEALPDYDWNE